MTTWVVKQSGSPKRQRVKAASFAELLREIGEEKVVFEDRDEATGKTERIRMSRRERVARVLCTMAAGGDMAAAKLVLQLMEGPPVQTVAVGVRAHFTADDFALAAKRLEERQAQLATDAQESDSGVTDAGPHAI